MFKKTGVVLCGLLLASAISYAENKSGVYVGGHIGAAEVNTSSTQVIHTYKVNGGNAGHDSYSGKRDVGLAGGASVGYDFKERYNTPIRVEVNYTARSDGKKSNTGEELLLSGGTGQIALKEKTNLQTLMVNLWADIPTNTAFTPYIGGGVGVAIIDYKTDGTLHHNVGGTPTSEKYYSESKKQTNFAWGLGGGVAYDVNDQFTVDLGYRYIDAGKVKINNINDQLGTLINGQPVNLSQKTKVKSNELLLEGRIKF